MSHFSVNWIRMFFCDDDMRAKQFLCFVKGCKVGVSPSLVASTVVQYKAMVLILSIHCLLLLSLFVIFVNPRFFMQYLVS